MPLRWRHGTMSASNDKSEQNTVHLAAPGNLSLRLDRSGVDMFCHVI